MTIRLPDYHIHTTLCNHAYGEMEEYVEHAINLGLDEIGFSEHMPVMPEPHLCLSYDDLPVYIDRVKKLRDRYSGKINIKLGAEMDMDLNRADEIKTIIESSEFDYVIGSIHYLDDWPFDQVQYKQRFEEGNIDEIYARFFENIIRAARSGLYDIAGHIDNLKRMGYHPEGDMDELYNRVAEVLKEMDVAFEINTSGYDYPAGETYPSAQFMKVLNSHGVPVTVGSDSHRPEHVGRHFAKAADVLKEAGYDHVAYFEGRERILKSF
ncbi:histidinol-phosphatase HisJ family protein [Candidatus Latescibacterota bacterium]